MIFIEWFPLFYFSIHFLNENIVILVCLWDYHHKTAKVAHKSKDLISTIPLKLSNLKDKEIVSSLCNLTH